MCFDQCEYVRLSVVVQTAALQSITYTERQMELYRHVFRLREIERLKYREIASRLRALGLQSIRGKQLSAELVFSIHKKGPAARNSRSKLSRS